MTTGHCQHGEFILEEGCKFCIAAARQDWTSLVWSEPKARKQLVKVRYFSETTDVLSAREYTYYSKQRLQVGDIVMIFVGDTTGKAKVTAIDVPEAEIDLKDAEVFDAD